VARKERHQPIKSYNTNEINGKQPGISNGSSVAWLAYQAWLASYHPLSHASVAGGNIGGETLWRPAKARQSLNAADIQ